jgi:amino acid permease
MRKFSKQGSYMSRKLLVALGIILTVVFAVMAVVYFTHAADKLPHYFPGYSAGETKMHDKHGIAAVILALAAAAFAWFQSGPNHQDTPTA